MTEASRSAATSDAAASPAPKRAVVVGGGIAGLASARRLALTGHSVTLLEATDRLGGLIHGVALGDHLVDLGAEAFAVARPETLELIHSLGLDDKLVSPANAEARIRANAQTFKIPHGLLGIPSDLADPLVLVAIGADAVAEAARLDAEPWQLEQAGTLAELVRTRLGQAVLDTLVTPVIAGVHASDPELLEVDVVAPGLFAKAKALGSLSAAAAAIRASAARPGSAVASLEGGMNTLISALASQLTQLGVEVRLNTPVLGALRTEAGYQLLLDNPAAERVTADLLVVATPPRVTANLLASLPSLANPLARIRAVDVTVVALKAQNRYIGRAPLGSGVLVAPGDTRVVAKASTHSSAKWDFIHSSFGPDQHLIRLSYGRDGNAPAADENLLATARQDAAALFGIDPIDVSHAVMQEWPGSLIQARTGHSQLLRELAAALEDFPNLAIVGAGLGGNGITGILAKANEQLTRIGA